MALGLTPKEIIDSGRHPLLKCSNEWERIELKEIADVQNGYAFKSEYFNHETGVQLIRIRDVGKDRTEELYSGEYDDDYLVNKGDILIGMDGDFRAAYWTGKPGLLNQRVCRIRNVDDSYSKKFLYYLLQPYLEAIHAETSAVTVKHLSSRTIQSIPLPNPPLPTQNRIVEKIEELFSELDNGVENLKKAQQQLKTYRQAVLKDAFEGKLTQKWRQQQDDLPTPEELLQQIKAERKAHRQRELAEWEKEVEKWEKDGKPGRKPRKPRRNYKPLPIDEQLIELPELWMQVRLCLLCSDITDGDHQAPPKSDSGYPFITISNINNNKIDFSDTFYVGEEYYSSLKKERKPQKGDVLYTVTGSFGIPVLVNFEKQFCFQRHIGLLRSFELVNQKWLYYIMQNPNVIQQAKKDATGTAQKTVSLTSLRQFVVSFMSEQEQKEIVNEIESRFSVVDQLEQTIKENLQKAEALRRSILKKAFGGELVL